MHSPSPSISQWEFKSLTELRTFLGGTVDIKKLLIANNGLAAVKGMNSIRQWLYDHLGDHEAIEFAVMASPEDLKANAEFISMADQHVEVPGGPNGNNYANVDLIMHTAVQCLCDAIYPGWGHASENPALPRECDRSKRVIFLGPSEEAMFALGDKIASTIVAQSNGVPCVPWSGDELLLPENVFDVDTAMYEKAYVTTAQECEEVCQRVGFPVMIKASEGGGGKGIRRCTRAEDVRDMFLAVFEEVKGCHIFVMRMMENVRHLEVQLLADRYGECIAVRTRDCSVQRRHQKIIEEGPVFGVADSVIKAMEKAAIRLAKAVRYSGLGTVEYMYDKGSGKFFFLELNPRIQVEHPVSELITGVNLPAAILCVGMGIPLHRIPEVRAFYGEAPYGDTIIDFENRETIPSKGHTIAVRVTAENAEEGFRPTSGMVEEITFRNSKECWGYFSIPTGGEVHQYADSQFGHIFSSGATREDARRGMVMALRNLVIRGEIHTTTSYVLDLLERQEFRDSDISTAWLDGLIAQRAMDGPRKESVHVALLAACIFRMMRYSDENHGKYTSYLTAGHTPSTDYLAINLTESYVCHSEKFTVRIGRTSPTEYAISLNGSIAIVPCRTLKSGALQMTVSGKTIIAFAEKEPTSIRVNIGGRDTTFTGDIDPTKLITTVPGRLVRYSVPDGGHITAGATYAEIEVMKMILTLRSATAGKLYHRSIAGSTITTGTLLAEIVPDDPSTVARPQENKDQWPVSILRNKITERLDGFGRARRAVDTLWNVLQGYHFSEISLKERLQSALDDISSLCLASVTIKALNYLFIAPEHLEAQSPNDKLRAVLSGLITEYLRVERLFDGYTRQEALAYLRDNKESDETFQLDFTHNQSCHHEVVKMILSYVEQNTALMKSMQDSLSALVGLRSYTYGSLLLQARYLLRQSSLPTFTERKATFAKEIELGDFKELMRSGFTFDIMCAVMFDRQMPHLIQLCLELFVRCEYAGECDVHDLDIFKLEGTWMGTYRCEPMEDHDPLRNEDALATNAVESQDDHEKSGYIAMFADERVMKAKLAFFLQSTVSKSVDDVSVCTIFMSVGREMTQEDSSHMCMRTLEEHAEIIATLPTLSYISFIVHGMEGGPHTFTFRRSLSFKEDLLIRNVAPLSARRLELDRLSNYNVSMYPSPFKDVHVFKAAPIKRGASLLENRMFVRISVSPREIGVPAWTEATLVDAGYMLAKCLTALEFARSDTSISFPSYNHIFIKMVELTFDISTIVKLLTDLTTSYQQKLLSLGVTETEISFQVKVPSGFVPFRVTVSNPSGQSLHIHLYYEWLEQGQLCLRRAETAEDVPFTTMSMSSEGISDMAVCSIGQSSTQAEPGSPRQSLVQKTMSKLAALRNKLPSRADLTIPFTNGSFGGHSTTSSNGSGPKNGAPPHMSAFVHNQEAIPLIPYPVLSQKQIMRLQARVAQTTYARDWALLMELSLQRGWLSMAQKRDFPRRFIPKRLIKVTELFADRETHKLHTNKDRSDPCGMLVWIIEYYPPSYANLEEQACDSRRIVLVANDITFQSGSFAVPEDVVFAAGCELARSEHIPFVYISANSGARVGLSAEVKKRFRVAFTENNEIKCLYLTKEDYILLQEKGVKVDVSPTTIDGCECYAIQGIIGSEDEYLGVENLRGSALLAGQMSKNYASIPTISVVSGRSVGIGAYLNRLGRRVIQTNDAPLILTGASALNRLLGKDVYSDNSQLGGKQVMVPNGVTHWDTTDDLRSIRVMLQWLDFVPPHVDPLRCRPRILTLPYEDPVNRDVTFTPQQGDTYDPRHLVTGTATFTGMFDRGSWIETMAGWAKTVVAGRATLGGIPCGVVLVETRVTKKFSPADPADPTSSASFVAQAGQVWFPDSARKTADALDDFHRERLPCFIFANWRGFSGGMRDMYDEVLKFGASIVDNLRVYNSPVFIYIPPFGELRGGAWVVVDPVINHCGAVEMYCDTTARGGILEPSAVVEIKFRDNDVRELIRRSNPALASMDPTAARDAETQMVPRYRDVALRFADLHDGPSRMKAKGVIVDVIPWKESRRMFHAKLVRKLKEMDIAASLVELKASPTLEAAVKSLQEAYEVDFPEENWGERDERCLAWLERQVAADLDRFVQPETHASNGISPSEKVMALVAQMKNMSGEAGASSLESCFAALFDDPRVYEAARNAMSRGVQIDNMEL